MTANRVITVNLLRGANLQILNVSRRKSPLLSLKKAKLFPDCTNGLIVRKCYISFCLLRIIL
ncbi:TPA: hypothetical protein HNI78_01680 [Escherichia coli]